MGKLIHYSLIVALLLMSYFFSGAGPRHLVFIAFLIAINFLFQTWIKRQIRLADQESEARRQKHKQRLQQWGQAISYGLLLVILIIASSAIPN